MRYIAVGKFVSRLSHESKMRRKMPNINNNNNNNTNRMGFQLQPNVEVLLCSLGAPMIDDKLAIAANMWPHNVS